MSKIEKMYKNAGVKAINIAKNGSTYIPDYIQISGHLHPPFTAEKQIELYCFILSQDKYVMTFEATLPLTPDVFAEGIAEATNHIWKDLTEEERKQIRKILE